MGKRMTCTLLVQVRTLFLLLILSREKEEDGALFVCLTTMLSKYVYSCCRDALLLSLMQPVTFSPLSPSWGRQTQREAEKQLRTRGNLHNGAYMYSNISSNDDDKDNVVAIK